MKHGWAHRWYLVALLALFLGWLPKIKATTVPWAHDNDFAHSYLTALMVRQGTSPYAKDLLPMYREHAFSPTRQIAEATNPPPLAVTMSPLTFLAPDSAYAVWVVVQLVSLASGVLLLISALGIRVSSVGALGLLVGSIAPLSTFALLRYGQSQGLIFFVISLGVWCARSGPRWLAPSLLGLASSFKLFTLPLIVVAFRYWGARGVAFFLCGFAVLWLPFVLWCGSAGLGDFFVSTVPFIQSLSLSFDANISLSAAVTYTSQAFGFGTDGVSSLAQCACLIILGALVFAEYRRSRACPDLCESVAYVVALCLLLSPTSWPHYIPLLTVLFLCLVRNAQHAREPQREMWWVLGLYLCVGSAIGFQRSGDILTQIVSAWWAPAWIAVASWRLMVSSSCRDARCG